MIPFLYPLLTAAAYYLGVRAKITSWLWSRYPAPVTSFMDCAACTGFWYGALCEAFLGRFGPLFNFTPATPWPTLLSCVLVGLCSLVWTPLVAALMQHSLNVLGTVVGPVDDTASPQKEITPDDVE